MKPETLFSRIPLVLTLLLLVMGRGGAADRETLADGSPTLQRILTQGKLRVCVHPRFKPFSFLNDQQERIGVDIDISRLLASRLGVQLELVTPEAFAALIPMLRQDRCDVIIAGMTITFERALQVAFTEPYFDTGLSILLNKAKAGELGIATASHYDELVRTPRSNGRLNRLIIAVAKGKAPARSVPPFFPGAQVQAFDTNAQAVEAVLAGKAHLMVHDELFLKVWWHDHKAQTLYKSIVFDEPFKPEYDGFAIRRGDQAFLNLLNVFIRELGSEGHTHRFLGAYLPVTSKVVARSYALAPAYYGGD